MNSSTIRDETERLAALHSYGILDTPPEPGFDHITSMMTRLFRVSIAVMTLVDAERQWFKSVRGLAVRETPRELSFCAHAMLDDDVMVVPDATLDPRFVDHPFVTGQPGVRFYAGATLRSPEGHPLGALCVIDLKPRRFSRASRRRLSELASVVEDQLLLRRAARELQTAGTLQWQQIEAALEKERESGRQLRLRLPEEPVARSNEL